MKINCKICGTVFEAKTSKHHLCSPECRRVDKIRYMRGYNPLRPKRRYKPAVITCKICGEPMNRVLYGRRKYHDECVIEDYINACNEGVKCTDPRKIRFKNFGFTKEDAEEYKAMFEPEEE